MDLNKLIQKEKTNTFKVCLKHKIPAILASIFSVIFAMSIVFELKTIVSGVVLTFLSIFIILFLIQNELFKIKEIKKVFQGNKASIIPFAITFVLSITLSSIGIYFWTNKAQITEDNAIVDKSIVNNNINQKYNLKIDSLSNLKFENTEEYNSLIKNLEYWKSRRAMDTNELKSIRANIKSIGDNVHAERLNFKSNIDDRIKKCEDQCKNEMSIVDNQYNRTINKTDTNNFITYIFFVLIFITEFAIIILNKNIAGEESKLKTFTDSHLSKKYIVGRNILESLYFVKDSSYNVNINNAKYSYANKDNVLEWSEVATLYNTYIQLGILDEGSKIDGLLTNEIVVDVDEALRMYDNYFEKIFKIG
jgi:hypothetical protein